LTAEEKAALDKSAGSVKELVSVLGIERRVRELKSSEIQDFKSSRVEEFRGQVMRRRMIQVFLAILLVLAMQDEAALQRRTQKLISRMSRGWRSNLNPF